jgi:hypothetical protein
MRLEHQLFVCYRRHLESRIETKIATIGVCIGQHHPSAGYSFSETGNPLFQGIHLHYDGSLQKPIQHNTDVARRSKSRTRAALMLRCRNWYDYIITRTWKKVKCLKSLIFSFLRCRKIEFALAHRRLRVQRLSEDAIDSFHLNIMYSNKLVFMYITCHAMLVAPRTIPNSKGRVLQWHI